MISVVLRNVALLNPCIGKSSTLSMEKQQKEGKYQERRMGCAKEAPKLKKNMLSVVLRNILLLYMYSST